ncbi:MAG: ABC transporter substrate-binding protein, partial [Planctomycetaceae bacterium]
MSVVVAIVSAGALVLGTAASSSTASGKGQAADDGTLTYGVVGNTNDKIWPYVPASSSSASFLRYQLYDTLTGYAHSGKFVMLLASKFVPSNRFRDWDVHLKKGIKFADGSTLTAKDVVFSIQSMFSKKHPANQPSILTMVNPKNVKAKSTYVVHFRLKRSFAPFPQVLGTPDFSMISHKSTYEKPIGTG